MSNLRLDLWWEPREPAQADDARRLSRFVNGLPDFDPAYRSSAQFGELRGSLLGTKLGVTGSYRPMV